MMTKMAAINPTFRRPFTIFSLMIVTKAKLGYFNGFMRELIFTGDGCGISVILLFTGLFSPSLFELLIFNGESLVTCSVNLILYILL